MALVLGKALFWDMQVGSDGVVACATCHFHAGADHRTKNQIHPAADSFHDGGPNRVLTSDMFPFRRLANQNNRTSTVLSDSNDVAGSQGIFHNKFVRVETGLSVEAGFPMSDTAFRVADMDVRQVTGRNSPSVINAIFNFRNFWDGRADFYFNGQDPDGPLNSAAHVMVAGQGGRLERRQILLPFASLASQAVGPPLSTVEMSYEGRTFPDIGAKLLALRPLGLQMVHPEDSVLGAHSRSAPGTPAPGLTFANYREMVQRAFRPEYWSSNERLTVADREHDQAAYNFALFFGVAIQMYESTLVSGDTPFDRFQKGDATALSATQRNGLNTFLTGSRCIQCHAGPEFAGPASAMFSAAGNFEIVRSVQLRNGGTALADTGFFNIGLRPTADDLGLASENAVAAVLAGPGQRTAVRGAFKAPSLRNVELTGPYFRHGGMATLDEVVAFYRRGGDFLNPEMSNDVRGIGGGNNANALVEFLRALTDERVRFERAPFDHPQLCVPDGHPGDSARVTAGVGARAAENLVEVPAVGANGNASPLQTFPELLQGVTENRAHANLQPCPISGLQ